LLKLLTRVLLDAIADCRQQIRTAAQKPRWTNG
jgi:hypothetical protein